MSTPQVDANKRRALARQFNDMLRPKLQKRTPRLCKCRRQNICCCCGFPMNRDWRYGDVRGGHNICADCMD
jgi:hypothetical protein